MKKKEEFIRLDRKPLLPFLPDAIGSEQINNTDPFGSYTGRTADPYEKPVQDADDL